jgi:hypothetical protein
MTDLIGNTDAYHVDLTGWVKHGTPLNFERYMSINKVTYVYITSDAKEVWRYIELNSSTTSGIIRTVERLITSAVSVVRYQYPRATNVIAKFWTETENKNIRIKCVAYVWEPERVAKE